MNSVNTIDIAQLLGKVPVASGVGLGRKVFAALVGKLNSLAEGAVFLDLGGVQAVTGSFFREAILPFKMYGVEFAHIVPVIANANADVEHEIEAALEARADAIVACKLTRTGPRDIRVLGTIDQSLATTLTQIREAKIATASRLAAQDRSIGAAAWHNRLGALEKLGLVVSNGAKPAEYRFVLKEE